MELYGSEAHLWEWEVDAANSVCGFYEMMLLAVAFKAFEQLLSVLA